jgi:hypothetical protein
MYRDKRWLGGCGQLWLGEQHIDHDRAQKLIKHAMARATALINIPESEVEQERFFAELEATEEEEGDDGEVVKQQGQDHKLNLEIAGYVLMYSVQYWKTPR